MNKDEEGRPICYHCRHKGGVAAPMTHWERIEGEWQVFHPECYQAWIECNDASHEGG